GDYSDYPGGSGGLTYGFSTQPTNTGSGGGGTDAGYPASGGRGGGAIKLNVSGTTTIDGSITANGENGGVDSKNYCGGGGGSGGSIYIITGTLAGNGSITTNGGNGGSGVTYGAGGGGAGGRIAIEYTTIDATNPIGNNKIFAYGGSGYQYGGAGTIYTKQASAVNGDLLVDNNNNSGA
ncbi:unnamed protein product, partial [marine sediment metagenome]